MPLGNLTSQFFANIYLHELDFFVKHKLAIPYYIRYVDDIVVLAENPAQLKNWHYQIEQFLNNNLQLTIHPQKTILQPTSQGLDFLGYIIRKNYVLVRKKVVRNFKRKLYFFNHPSSKWRTVFAKSFVSSINSYLGIFSFADSYQLRKKSYLCYLKIMQKGTYASNKFKKIKQYKCNL